MSSAIEEEEEEEELGNYKTPQKHLILHPKTQFSPFVSQIYLEPSTTFMDLDFTDLDSSWTFDQIPPSPILLSTSDQTYSPLWAFADAAAAAVVDDDRDIKGSADFSRISTCNLEPTGANTRLGEEEGEENYDNNKNKNKKKLPSPFIGLGLNNSDVSFVIKERMTQALRNFKESTDQTQILAQIWAPVKDGNRNMLTTSGQPFVLGHNTNGLHQYRTVSLMYMFSVDGKINETLGLPGRVFRQKLPEWTPNVQYYSSKEYPRVNHAKHCNVRGTLALPVFEPSGQSCVGVLELIMTSEKINYAPEVDKVCKALEAVNLKTSKVLDHPNIQICNEGRQNALSEILEVLTEVCETYKLPLAQTWIPCMHRSVLAYGGGFKKSCSSFDGSCMGQVCMSTTDVALYVVDAHMWGFRDACAEHHLQKGQGVVGRAFSSHGLCFCRDISLFSKIEYPLVHYARMFRLTSSFAVCLRSKHTGDDDYILEFFLPSSVTEFSDQIKLLDSILTTMKHDLQNLVVASGRSLEEERKHMEIVEVVCMDENPEDLQGESNLSTNRLATSDAVIGLLLPRETDPGKAPVEGKEMKKTSERKRGKAEKQISLEVLQQYFAGSLKDAAKSLGVCPTTMKRICRQHGISRWPSRKINKVNRSLTKLRRVIESVQGTDGTFTLTSLASPTTVPPAGSIGSNPKPNGLTGGWSSSPEERPHEQNEFRPKAGSGSREVSSSTSHGSSYGSPGTESNPPNLGFLEPSVNPTGLCFPSVFVEDVGSSKDLRNLGSLAIINPTTNESPIMAPRFTITRQDTKTVTIKATYREDIIRFRFSFSSNINELKEEVAKRFKLEIGTFETKYLDDDQEWVLIACESDLQECLDIAKPSGSNNTIRLLVQDISVHVGSSCESSGERYGFL